MFSGIFSHAIIAGSLMIIKALNCSTILDDNSDERTESVSPLIYKIFSHQITISHASKRSTSSKQQQQQQREEEARRAHIINARMYACWYAVCHVCTVICISFICHRSQPVSQLDGFRVNFLHFYFTL